MNFGGRARVNAAGGEPKITCGFYKAPIISLFATAPTAAVRRTNHDATRLFRVGVSSLVAARFVGSNLSPSLRIGNLKARKTAAELQPPSTKGHAIFHSLSA
jgi:hypothetical protein